MPPAEPLPLGASSLDRPSASPVRASLSAATPGLCHKTSKQGPYLETRREKEASRDPRTQSSGHKRCLRSCWGTRRLCREPR